MNLLWLMDPQSIENRCLEYHYPKHGRWTYFGQWNPQMHHGIYIIGCIWQPCWILQEKVGISSYFWIIRVVNSLLALYSHVICTPLNTPPKHSPNDNTNFNYESSYVPGLICNIVVKSDLLADLPTYLPPTPKCIMGYVSWDVFGSHFGFFMKGLNFLLFLNN